MGFMELQRMLFLEAQVSVQAFCSTLDHLQAAELPFGKMVCNAHDLYWLGY